MGGLSFGELSVYDFGRIDVIFATNEPMGKEILFDLPGLALIA